MKVIVVLRVSISFDRYLLFKGLAIKHNMFPVLVEMGVKMALRRMERKIDVLLIDPKFYVKLRIITPVHHVSKSLS